MEKRQNILLQLLLEALFVRGDIEAPDKMFAAEYADLLGDECPDWVLMIEGANREKSKVAAKEAAKWFCVWWLENNDPELLKGVRHED